MIFCTLFNSLYLDKGITLYQSLDNVTPNLKLYVLCMDEKCFDVLSDLSFDHLIPIRLSDVEGPELLNIKSERSIGEYCWTCTSWCIDYVLSHYNEEYCTYIDADMAFYSDPSVILEEMKKANASVQVVEHCFNPYESKRSEKKVGKFCVEFNTFKNDTNGRALLNLWKYQCLTKCTIKDESGRYWADQKYLNHWVDDFPYVISTSHIGVGLAPWNMMVYSIQIENNGFKLKKSDNVMPLICCHFESLTYLNENTVNIHAIGNWNKEHDNIIAEHLYRPYLMKIKENQRLVKDKYGFSTLIKYHPEIEKASISDRVEYIYKIFTQTRFIPYCLKFKLPNMLFKKRNIISLADKDV